MSQDKVTPRPWKVVVAGPTGKIVTVENLDEDIIVAQTDFPCQNGEDIANAILIVRAVNSFDNLLSACKKFLEIRGRKDAGVDQRYSEAFDMAELAIAKAEKP